MQTVTLATGETLIFYEVEHLYLIDGKPCPGTHSLMERHGIVKPLDQWGAPYADRGKRVDFYTQAWDEDDLDREDVDSSERGYLDAWIQFKEKYGVTAKSIQLLVGSAQLWYATTLDRVIVMSELVGKIVLNIKTGNRYKSHPIQSHLEGLLYPDAERVQMVYLAPDGSYDLQDYTDDDAARKTATAIAQANGMAHSYMARRKSRKEAAIEQP
jgi:hypothetical protein